MASLPIEGLPAGTPLIDIHNTIGAIYIGSIFSVGLLGVTMVQAWLYFDHCPKDPIWMKSVVLAICVVEFLRCTFTSHAAYYYLVQNWGNPTGLNILVWSLKSILLTTKATKVSGHLFFSWRIYMLSPRRRIRNTLTAATVLMTLVDLGKSIQAQSMDGYSQERSQKTLNPLGLAIGIAADITVSCCMVFVLSRSKTGFSKTNRLLNAFIFYAVEAGLITVMAGAAALALDWITSAYMPYVAISFQPFFRAVYTNSLLAILNARMRLRVDVENAIGTTSHLKEPNTGAQGRDAFFRARQRSNAVPDSPSREDVHRTVHLKTFFTTGAADTEDQKLAKLGTPSITSEVARTETSYGP
ncbi:hypothetical protein PENSPDRAFT_660433 [Peniophora sp. CONT]|nr:hypothetical protein PENSPDRAFT_660433 [Peniophora sp. CONT]